MKLTASHTRFACYLAYTVQALVINFPPLLFVCFRERFGLSYTEISVLIFSEFLIQLAIDLLSSFEPLQRVSRRLTVVVAMACSVTGMILLAILPFLIPPFAGLLIGMTLAAAGSGFCEVVISPLVTAAAQGDGKDVPMSFLHSFYCWGQMFTVLLSTGAFALFGIGSWPYVSAAWALLPAFTLVLFLFVPIYRLPAETKEERRASGHKPYPARLTFWIFFLIMICSGASELAMSQWASTLAETSLGVEKSVGDLLGPCLFAFFMALGRVLHSFLARKVRIEISLTVSAVLCIGAYLLTALTPLPYLALAGCALCGFSVAVFWPGTLEHATAKLSGAGEGIFAAFAFAGDLGCISGPFLIGALADSSDLRASLLVSTVFPAVLLVSVLVLLTRERLKKSI